MACQHKSRFTARFLFYVDQKMYHDHHHTNFMVFTSIKWIFFDVGGVLLDDAEAEDRRTKLLLDVCIKHNQSLAIEDIVHARQIASAKTGSIEENVIKCLLRDQTSQQVAQNEFKERKKEIGYDQYSKIRPDALKVAELLSKKYKLGIMANQPIHRTKQLEECGLIRYFHHSDMWPGPQNSNISLVSHSCNIQGI
jgi:FMN phosphatase YigB (HAD superfamily)